MTRAMTKKRTCLWCFHCWSCSVSRFFRVSSSFFLAPVCQWRKSCQVVQLIFWPHLQQQQQHTLHLKERFNKINEHETSHVWGCSGPVWELFFTYWKIKHPAFLEMVAHSCLKQLLIGKKFPHTFDNEFMKYSPQTTIFHWN